MFLILLAAASSAPAQSVQTCSGAMRLLGRVPAELILTACPQPGKIDLWGGDDTDHRCDSALTFARSVAKSAAGLPTVMIDGMIREFDKRVAKCSAPVETKPLPSDSCETSPKLWC